MRGLSPTHRRQRRNGLCEYWEIMILGLLPGTIFKLHSRNGRGNIQALSAHSSELAKSELATIGKTHISLDNCHKGAVSHVPKLHVFFELSSLFVVRKWSVKILEHEMSWVV